MGEWSRLRERTVVYEDAAVVVLNKPTGLSVLGERHDTDLVRLAGSEGETLFPVHRIDKVTSGALLLAKELSHHGDLTRQFNKRTVEKVYLAVTRTGGLPAQGRIELPLSVGRKSRVRVAAPREAIVHDGPQWTVPAGAVFAHAKTYPSVTTFTVLWTDGEHTLLAVEPKTGRRHQIRVHLAWTGHPILGDPLFDKEPSTRTYLHSWRLGFDALWDNGSRIRVEAPPGDDFWAGLPARVDRALA